jgi:hypothetical protein
MRTVILGLKLLAMAYLGTLFLFLLTSYDPATPGFHPPFFLWLIDTINLFIHEAGHLFFRVLGQWMHILGGTLFQCLVPLALLVVVWRQNRSQIWYPGFWLGESMVNASAYIQDAPYRKLKLIASGLIHDWWWLLDGDPDAAALIGGTVYWLGIACCAGALGAGVYFAIGDYREDRVYVPPD